MDILNYSIDQNQIFPIKEMIDELPIYNLELYEEMGDNEYESGNESEALRWYTKGLNMARQLKNENKIKRFTNLILASL